MPDGIWGELGRRNEKCVFALGDSQLLMCSVCLEQQPVVLQEFTQGEAGAGVSVNSLLDFLPALNSSC